MPAISQAQFRLATLGGVDFPLGGDGTGWRQRDGLVSLLCVEYGLVFGSGNVSLVPGLYVSLERSHNMAEWVVIDGVSYGRERRDVALILPVSATYIFRLREDLGISLFIGPALRIGLAATANVWDTLATPTTIGRQSLYGQTSFNEPRLSLDALMGAGLQHNRLGFRIGVYMGSAGSNPQTASKRRQVMPFFGLTYQVGGSNSEGQKGS